MKALIVVLLLLVARPVAAEDGWPLHVAIGSYMALNGADLATTMFLIGGQRGTEANPFFAPFSDRPALFGAVKMGIDTAAVAYILKIHKAHPKLAWGLTVLGIVVESYATVHNARIVQRHP